MQRYAVITGASQGLGKSFANELAKREIHLILISLPNQNLSEFSRELQEKHKINVHYFEIDLSNTGNVLALANQINDNYDVFMLINNAGIGGTKRILDADVSYISKIIQVNVMATSLFTRQFLPNLLKQSKGYILNVASLAAFTPTGYKTVYPASKSFVYSFSRALNEELKDSNLVVSVVNPGAMATNSKMLGISLTLGIIRGQYHLTQMLLVSLIKMIAWLPITKTNGIFRLKCGIPL
jgi:short-subunit dehydrogenase